MTRIMRRLSAIAAIAILGACGVIGVAPGTATPTATLSETATPPPAPTAMPLPSLARATPRPTRDLGAATTFVNDRLGYSVRHWAPWRRSPCMSTIAPSGTGSQELGADAFTILTETEERNRIISDVGGAQTSWGITVRVESNRDALDAAGWAAAHRSEFGTAELVTLGGRDTVKLGPGGYGIVAYVVFAPDRLFVLALTEGDAAGPSTARDVLEAMAASVRVGRPVPPTPSPPTEGTPEALADGLAAAFAARDVAALGALITPACYFTLGLANAGAVGVHPSAELDALRTAFAGGLAVVVSARPIAVDDPSRPYRTIRATWTEKGETRGVSLQLRVESGRWYWDAIIFDRPAAR